MEGVVVMKISPAAYQELRTIYLNMSKAIDDMPLATCGTEQVASDALDRAHCRFASFLIKADQVNSL
jgi:hypothetical protein